MRSALRLIVVVLLLLMPASVDARELVKPPRVAVTVMHEPCPVGGGTCSDPAAGIVYLAAPDRFALEHERGHIFDRQILTAGSRALFTRLIGLPRGLPWAPTTGDGCSATRCPSELFADAYAACRLGIRRERYRGVTRWETAYGYTPTPVQHYRICAAIRRVYFKAFGLARVTRDRAYPNRRARIGRLG